MGGSAFTHHNPPLPTPRLSPSEYFAIRDALVGKLGALFGRVAVPIEAPAKDSYGDVDILVCEPRLGDSTSQETASKPLSSDSSALPSKLLPLIEAALQPVARREHSLAIPKANFIPEQSAQEPCTYVQVDVTVCDPDRFAWQIFLNCHGDIWNMLAPSLRPLGLVMTDQGLCVIHPEVEPYDKKRARIVLSRDPNAVLSFVGLDPGEFWGLEARPNLPLAGELSSQIPCKPLVGRRFGSDADQFTFICSSRFFDPAAYIHQRDLKACDRKRLRLRGAYRRFVTEWLPSKYPSMLVDSPMVAPRERSNVLDGTESFGPFNNVLAKRPSRKRATEEALAHFGKTPAWEEMISTWRSERAALREKQATREARKELLAEDNAYADAWMQHIRKEVERP